MATSQPPTDGARTVLDSQSISNNGKWWSGIVHDRDENGTERIRLELYCNDGSRGQRRVHTWRVRPEYWPEEWAAVDRFLRGVGGSRVPANPIDPDCDVHRFETIRKDEHRWVAVAEVTLPSGGRRTRLYHWELPGEQNRQTWNVDRMWTDSKRRANAYLKLLE